MPLSLFAQTPTIADLQAQIQLLMKQIQAVQALKAGTPVVSTVSGVGFTTDMGLGSSGSQVVSLQQFLISKGFLVIPPGVSTGYYGNLTALGVKKFQTTYAILSTGFVGPITRVKLNSLRGPSSILSGPSTTSRLVTNTTTGGGISSSPRESN